MKKNLKNALLALVLIAAGTGAYATKALNAPKADEEIYTWSRTDGTPQPGETDPFVGTKTDAINNYGCDGEENQCAVGEPQNPLLPNEVIYLSN